MSDTDGKITFHAADYAVFSIMLVASAGIGVFYAWKEYRSKTNNEKSAVQDYLMGGRNMSYIPVSISLSLSFVSAVTILGVPAEIYLFGSMYVWLMACIFISVPPVTEVFIPVFYRLGISSSFEYLQLRYNYTVRLVATTIYILQNVMYIGVMIYAPAVAISSVTNLSLVGSVISVALICTFYTTLGGLKAVIWTDVLQGAIVLVGMLLTMFACAESVGGWGVVWRTNADSGRIDFGVFDPNPRIRHSFWSVVVGLGFLWMSIYGTSQSQVQRYLCCKTELDAKKGIIVSMAVSGVLFSLSVFTGFVMFAYFKDCDPIMSKKIASPDQLVPYMVLSVFQGYPGLPGLFVASVFAAALSTVSSGINAMACVTVEDYIRPYVKWKETTLAKVSKILVFTYGALCMGFALISQHLGGILQASLSVLGIVGGPLLGIFTMGIIFPCANSKGAIAGMLTGMIMTTWIFIGTAIYHPRMEYLRFKQRFVDGCATPVVIPVPPPAMERPAIADDFYSVSYAYYTAIGFAFTIAVGMVVSMLTRGYQERTEVNPKLMRPPFDHRWFRWLPEKFRKWMWCGVDYDTIDKHEILEMPKKPTSIRRRWSSRERINSMRLGLKMWKDVSPEELENLTPEESAAMLWRMRHSTRRVRHTDDERNLNSERPNTRSQTLPTRSGGENGFKLKEGRRNIYNKYDPHKRSHKTVIDGNISLKDKLLPSKAPSTAEDVPSIMSSDVESGVPSMWI